MYNCALLYRPSSFKALNHSVRSIYLDVRGETFQQRRDCLLDEKHDGADVLVVADEGQAVDKSVEVGHVRRCRKRGTVLKQNDSLERPSVQIPQRGV